ncbi:unknown [Parabacteroides sp. CAG:409]|nr:unknown [Parabacteroides sp. CAG:409]
MKKLFTLFILLCLLPLAAWAQAQTQETKYIYYTWDNDTQTCIPNNGTAQTATVVTTGVTQWGGDESDKEYWYVVNDEINIHTHPYLSLILRFPVKGVKGTSFATVEA